MVDVLGLLHGGQRRFTLAAVLTISSLLAAVFVAPVWADEEIQMVEGSATDITSWGFNPLEVTVQAGQVVTFRNTGGQSHTATAGNGAFDTGLVPPGESKTLTVAAAGAYPFVCTPHPWMKGTLIITAAAAAPAPAPAAQAVATPTAAAAAPAPVAKPAAQAEPTPTPFRLVTTTTAPTTTSTAPRAGSMPLELALPFLVGGGAAALAGAAYLLRTGRRRED